MGLRPYATILYGWEFERGQLGQKAIEGGVFSDYILKRIVGSIANHSGITMEDVQKIRDSDKELYEHRVENNEFDSFIDQFEYMVAKELGLDEEFGGEYIYDYVWLGVEITPHSDPDRFIDSIISARYTFPRIVDRNFLRDFIEEMDKPRVHFVEARG